MTTAVQPAGGPSGGPSSSSLADVVDTILDKGLVLDAYVRVSLVGIELVTIDARVVVASVDTYLQFADAVNRLDIAHDDPKSDLTDIVGDVTQSATKGAAKGKGEGVLEAAGEKLGGLLGGSDNGQESKRVRSHREDR